MEIPLLLQKSFLKVLLQKQKQGIGSERYPVNGCKNSLTLLAKIPLVFFCLAGLSSCQSSRTATTKPEHPPQLDGFSHNSFDDISQQAEENQRKQKSLAFESEWLKLRLQVVEAERYVCSARSAELELASEMSRFGSLDKKLPGEGFIRGNHRSLWNARLESMHSSTITAEARANLLRRDLFDLKQKIVDLGYHVPEGPVVSRSLD